MRCIKIITVLIFVFCIVNVPLAASAGDDSPAINETTAPEPDLAPFNPEFIEHMDKLEGDLEEVTYTQSFSPSLDLDKEDIFHKWYNPIPG